MAKRSWRPYLMFAHFTCRSFLAECLCTIPAAKALLAFGAGSRKSSLHRSLASASKTRCHSGRSSCSHLSKALGTFFFVCMLLEIACNLQRRIAPCSRDGGVETSCREVHLRKTSYSVILSLERIKSLQLLPARTGGGAYLAEICRQGKCDNARLQRTAVRQASVWVRCIRYSDTLVPKCLQPGANTTHGIWHQLEAPCNRLTTVSGK